jgi:hypothetical protein
MSKDGFIYLDRKFFNHSMWREKRVFSRQEAWLDLIQLARWSHEPENVAIKDKVIACNRGQLVRSMVTLADRWGWSKSKVKRVLDVFADRDMIRIENETVTTRITLCNYETYQTKDAPSETQAERKQNASRTQVDTEEEGKKERRKEESPMAPSVSLKFPTGWNPERANIQISEIKKHRSSIRAKKLSNRSFQILVNRFKDFTLDDFAVSIETSAANGWTGIFPPKEKNKPAASRAEPRQSNETLEPLPQF